MWQARKQLFANPRSVKQYKRTKHENAIKISQLAQIEGVERKSFMNRQRPLRFAQTASIRFISTGSEGVIKGGMFVDSIEVQGQAGLLAKAPLVE